MEHQVFVDLPKRELSHQNVTFEVRSEGALLGRLHVSQGRLAWQPKGSPNAYRLTWESFDKLAKVKGSYGKLK